MARTAYEMKFSSDKRGIGGHASVVLALTNDPTTTAVVQMAGGPFGRLRNTSGASVTITFTEATSLQGTSLALVDQYGTAQPTFTVANNTSRELPDSVKGCEYLILTADSGTPSVNLHLER